MFNVVCSTNKDIKKHSPNWPEIPNHPYRILIVEVLDMEKTNALLNLVNNNQDFVKIFMLKIKIKQNISC